MSRPFQRDEFKLEADCIVMTTLGPEAIELIKRIKANIDNCQDEKEKIRQLRIAEHAFKNLEILAYYFQTVFTNGVPKELVFIDHEGNKFDLAENKKLDENELVDIFLDNPKKS